MARDSPHDNVEVPPHPGTIKVHPRAINPYIHLQLQNPGGENGDPRVDTARHGVGARSPSVDC